MPDVLRSAARARGPRPVAPNRRSRSAIAAFGKLEAQRARHWVRFGEAKRQALTHPIRLTGGVADEHTRGLVVAEIFGPEVADEHEPVTAQVLDRREKAERLNPCDPAFDQLPDAVREIGRDIAVDRRSARTAHPPRAASRRRRTCKR